MIIVNLGGFIGLFLVIYFVCFCFYFFTYYFLVIKKYLLMERGVVMGIIMRVNLDKYI